MKNAITYVFLFVMMAGFASCVKSYTCACTTTYEPGANMPEQETYDEQEIKGVRKKIAQETCEALSDDYSTYMRKTCALK